ncbi:MAG: thymidine phosphorylase [Clostridia bacterium]|nr:thymidine phosphorylase [Clostridia bacterium]
MNFNEIIRKKRFSEKLNKDEIDFFVKHFTDGTIPDYQASALLMAICINGMDEEETYNLTFAMLKSGEILNFNTEKLIADKHSTGGVGDKTTFIVTPLFAAMGGKSVKMSGRGLGHTGGTADKIESIPNIKINLTKSEILNQINKVGACMITQSENIAVADKKIYALRNATETVESNALIASSIMSKKLGCGADVIVLDVKFGSGAFMKTKEQAEKLAKIMINIGKEADKKVSVILSDMNIPLGYNIGNSLEIIEAIEVLKNNGDKRLRELSINLAAKMYSLAFSEKFETSLELANSKLSDLSAFNKFSEIIKAQGGDITYIEDTNKFKKAKHKKEIFALSSGYISKIDTQNIGKVSLILGAGRLQKTDVLDLSAGIILNKTLGDKIQKGELLATLHTDNSEKIEKAKNEFLKSIHISKNKPHIEPVIYKILD